MLKPIVKSIVTPILKPIVSSEGGVPFDPLSLNPILWLDAQDASTVTIVGGMVDAWLDKSGNGNDFGVQSVGFRPSYDTSVGINGLPAIRFTVPNTEGMIGPIILPFDADLTFFMVFNFA